MTWSMSVLLGEHAARLHPAATGSSVRDRSAKPVLHLPWVDVAAPTSDRQQIADLSAANQGKDECLAMVAHELRNALGPMSTAADVLGAPGVSAPSAELAVGIITRQLRNMTRLVNDLVDGTRITQGTMELRREPTDLHAVLHHAMEDVAEQVELRDQHVTVVVPDEHRFVLGDASRLVQAFGNLLSNASKFSLRGGRIWLSAEILEGPDDSAEVVVHIRDEGIGISPDMRPHVFELFKQAGRSPHHAPGLGVGLALVRRIVELHGGRVSLCSTDVDKGSDFTVSLPLIRRAGVTS